MVDNKKDNETDFDDDAFDVDEFSDVDFDDATLEDDNEFAELSPDDVDDYADEDSIDEDWQDDEEESSGKKGKKQKSLYSDGEKKGLSFNTMVIIGAVVVGGGVLVFNVMSKTAEQQAGQKTVFQSIMSMAGVMDGTLWGDKDDEALPAGDTSAQLENKPDSGFLNDPNTALPTPPPTATANPPQPSPIAPAENGEQALTPMPTAANGETPRGPDETPPSSAQPEKAAGGSEQVPVITLDSDDANKLSAVPAPETPAAAPTGNPSAEDILKQAMANREQKQTPPVADKSVAADKPSDVPEPEQVADANSESPVVPTTIAPAPSKTPEQVPAVTAPAADPEEVSANKQAVENLEGKIDTLLKRMDQIESDLGTVKESKGEDYQQIQSTVDSLKEEITQIKQRPAASKPVREKTTPKEDIQQEASDETMASVPEEAKPAPAPAPKKKVKKAAATSVSTRWELRAAQPGRAWVSKPGERDMQGIEVGQTLAGIGKVTAISYQNGRWTVYGTQGQINQ